MGPETVNKNKDCEFHGHYAGHNQYNIILLPDSEREFIVTYDTSLLFYWS